MAKRGRKPYIQEMELKEVANLATATVKSLLKRGDLTPDQLIRLAVPILLKRMPDKIETEGLQNVFQLIIPQMVREQTRNRLTAETVINADEQQ